MSDRQWRELSDRQWRELNASRQWWPGMFGRLLVRVRAEHPGYENAVRYLVLVRGVPLEHEGPVSLGDALAALAVLADRSGAHAVRLSMYYGSTLWVTGGSAR
jgi:hypothetical protein